MTNIDTQIIFDKNGNPIPQYLDVADKTGGSAGTMKPITKNSYPEIQDVNVTNQQALPTDYPDVAVKQELELIKAQQQQILDRLDEPVPTQLTGSRVEEQIIHERKIRDSYAYRLVTTPSGARGCIVKANTFGITGSFEGEEGLRVDAWGYSSIYSGNIFTLSTPNRSKTPGRGFLLMWYPGLVSGDLNHDGGLSAVTGLLLPPYINFRLDITGTFGEGEGIDSELLVTWIY